MLARAAGLDPLCIGEAVLALMAHLPWIYRSFWSSEPFVGVGGQSYRSLASGESGGIGLAQYSDSCGWRFG